MNKITVFMSEDHKGIDGIFRRFQNGKNSDRNRIKRLFSDFKINLQRHIVWEEEILFPLFESRTGMANSGPTVVMRTEHKQIKKLLEKIHDNINRDKQTYELEKDLMETLTLHSHKEENILYPWIDGSVSEKEKKEAITKMKGRKKKIN